MFTVCPDCQRQFRLYAEHIAAAAGQVRCGFCQTQFNALERLYDQPLTREQLLDMANRVQTLPEEPQFEIPRHGQDDVTPVKDEPPAQETGSAIPVAAEDQDETLAKLPETGNNQADVVVKEQDNGENKQKAVDADASKTKRPENRYAFDEEALYIADREDDAGRRMNAWWSAGVLMVLLLIALQLAWFQRDRVLLDYPELRPYVTQLCEKLDCRVIRERDTSAISLINRDVRLHPTYQDTLLVNATMQNELSIRQPYPQVQLTLFDTAGTLIGYREFKPTDYLDASINIDEGMPVGSPVHFVLEVAGSSEEAVSFEFRFL